MNTQNDLLFGMVAFQTGAVEADRLAETCAEWSADKTRSPWPTGSWIADA